MEEISLAEKLKEYAASDALPMHMPGHKRNAAAFPWLVGLGCSSDITEIEGFDDLNDPRGLFAELEARAARLYGADESVCLVNGSTGGILAAVFAVLEGGGELLMARASHKSLYNAAEITGANVRYIAPRVDPETGIVGSVTAEDVRLALEKYPGVRLAAITSPTYEGVISDVAAIADVCREHGVILLVDEAHGAHLGFGGFHPNAASLGADIVVASLHKTLPSLTQTAIMLLRRGLVDVTAVRRASSMFGTSSPSYILSSSIDGCIRFLESNGNDAAMRWREALAAFRRETEELTSLRILRESGAFYALDESKIVILTSGTDLSGVELAEIMRKRFNIEPEMTASDRVIAMTGMGDTEESLGRLASAICEIDKMCRRTERGGDTASELVCKLPERVMTVREAVFSEGEFVPGADAEGRVCGEYIWAYPPGIPMAVPGEIIDGDVLRSISSGVNIRSTVGRGRAPDMIYCLRK